MRVLGVDPGLTRCGLGAVEGRRGRSVSLIAVDVIRTPSQADLAERLLGIAEALDGWLDQLQPDVVAVERVFSQANLRTVMGTAQAAGVAVLAAARHGIPVALHTPSEVKAAVTGSGRAGKLQVATMVTRILDLPTVPRPADAADALALAICHLWRDGTLTGGTGLPGSPTAAQRTWVEAIQHSRQSRHDPVPGPAPGPVPGAVPGAVPGKVGPVPVGASRRRVGIVDR